MTSFGIEVRVGAFVLVAVAVLVGFVLVLGDFSLAPGFEVHADFAYSGGLQKGAPVKVSGIRIGRVADLSILGADSQPASAAPASDLGRITPPVVRASLVLEESARPLLNDGTRLYVGMQGLIGEAYVEVTPGSGDPIAEGASVRGVDAPRLHLMALQLSSLLGAMEQIFGEVGGVSDLGVALTRLLGSVDAVVGDNRMRIQAAIADSALAAGDLREVTGGLRRAVGDGGDLRRLIVAGGDVAVALGKDVPALLAEARRTIEKIESLTAWANRALDPVEVKAIVGDLRQTLAHLEQTTLDARRVMDTIRRGQGTIGGLVSDPQTYDDLREILRDLKRNPWKMFWRD